MQGGTHGADTIGGGGATLPVTVRTRSPGFGTGFVGTGVGRIWIVAKTEAIPMASRGAALRSRAAVKAADFEWVQGAALVSFYESSPGNHRGFCRVCGSPILSKFDAHPSYCGLPLGALDDDPRIRPALHVHVSSKAPWFTITDDLPQLPEGPTGWIPGPSPGMTK